MISVRNGKGTLQEKVFELVSEYGALKAEQVRSYFSLEDAHMERTVQTLIKKGRLRYDRQNGYIKTYSQDTYDEEFIRCFWVVIDLMNTVEFHGAGKYPLYIAMYADAKVYEIYCCKKGEELALEHAIKMLKEQVDGRVLIVIEDMEQIPKLNIENCTFCMVSTGGEVKYFE